MTKLEKYLESTGISQRHLAQKISTTPNNLSLLVRGKSSPSLRLAWEIEKATNGNVTVYDWLPTDKKRNKKDNLLQDFS